MYDLWCFSNNLIASSLEDIDSIALFVETVSIFYPVLIVAFKRNKKSLADLARLFYGKGGGASP